MKSNYTDEDLMPFGKYKGWKLANVPAEYLIWLYENNRAGDGALFYYIKNNLDVLEDEVSNNQKTR